ncbi:MULTISPECIES: S-methyl-5-thioribose-1-phosphate isomerase [unclassified Caballeronia]|uniref:S-methyl-5-thioribose-1-phosphate isomerase n=1 Tax=unclassified Caballeronia TaxID=2646786 RepID=UPI0028580E6D|nr:MULTISPECIES: S-methyl-5-thioribose-1-phosphate isomerase [unclassified Caballeronia]MDR5822957.1 S-methyl-5-thioribose-1-phosphate isomerase [Caballeronia sp. LZ043]MDR5881016.1 S-methyl-5-thioribose-1-phosphate isomerase [Caballeronia sp. LZ032]
MDSQRLFSTLPPTIEWRDGDLLLLDQTRLPHEIVVENVADVQSVWRAIRELRVRGAPAIGVAAAYGLCIAMRDSTALPIAEFRAALERQAVWLESARPTAVNLSWGLRRMLDRARATDAHDAATLYQALVEEARRIHEEDVALCEGIGMHGMALIREGSGVLTHCNAGALATTGTGTATAPIYAAHRAGRAFKVYADETRPLLQGARLTAFELQQAGVDVTLIMDSAAASIMSQGLVDLVIVGTDRVAANGDFANKIGTLGVAIAAHHYGIPFYVACPSSTLDLHTAGGARIEIEERAAEEVTHLAGRRVAPDAIQARNPAFDVTPHALVTGFITERGIVKPPFEHALRSLFAAEGNAA